MPGGVAIYDYKSGSSPTDKEARAFHLQLPLEAAIADAGGFESVPAAPRRPPRAPEVRQDRRDPRSSTPTSTKSGRRFLALIAHYLDEANGFPARLRPQKLTWGSDYDHLSRKGEWADGDDPEESW